MKQAYSRGISGLGQFGILIGLTGVGFIAALIVSIPLLLMSVGTMSISSPDVLLKPEHLNTLLWMQVITTIFAFFLPAVAFAFICYKKGWTFLGFTGQVNVQQVISVIVFALCALPLIAALGELNKIIPIPAGLRLKFDAMEKSYTDQVSMIAQVNNWKQYFTSLFIIAILPAIVEEALFRGALQNLLTRWSKSPWLAIIISSILFSAIHFSWYGFIPRMMLGVALGVLFYYGQSIWLNILAHFINNGLVVTSLFIASRNGQKVDVSAEDHFPIWAVAASVVLVGAAIVWFIRSSPPAEPVQEEITFDASNPFADHVE